MIKKTLTVLILLLVLFSFARSETIEFGKYWQNDQLKTPIEWIILDETEDAYLLISKYSLGALIFNTTKPTTWENSQLRTYLNGYFYKTAFSKEDRDRIIKTEIITPLNDEYPLTNQGAITYDKVFVLSIQEVEKYFPEKSARVAYATNYARKGTSTYNWNGAYTSPITGATCWRLRSMGANNLYVTAVRENGSISYAGDILYSPHYAFRPCIWITK